MTIAGLAAVFVGAGLSRDCGLPDWNTLLEPLRKRANVPNGLSDPTVAAEYISSELGEDKLFNHLLKATDSSAAPSRTHELLTELGARRVWTTNYDQFLERAFGSNAFTIVNESDFSRLQDARAKTVIVKLHGSVGHDHNKLPSWTRPPIITRSHFEGFASERPLLWTDVTANFLTMSFLFLGFSFDDPNVEVLLRLSRSMPTTIRRLSHYAVMKRPRAKDALRLAELRWRDLERAGIKTVVIDEYDEIADIVAELRRRLRPAGLFVAGSELRPEIEKLFEAAGKRLAQTDEHWHLNSLSSSAARAFGRGMTDGLKAAGRYDPERLRFHFRNGGHPAGIRERMGTVVYHEEDDKNIVRRRVLADSRVVLAAGGDDGTAEELAVAVDMGLPVIALPAGGSSERAFSARATDRGAPELREIVVRASIDPVGAADQLAELLSRRIAT